MAHHGLGDALVDFNEQVTQDVVADVTLTSKLGQFIAVDPEIGQPIGAFAISLDGISKAPLFPQPTHEHIAANLLNHFSDAVGNIRRITSKTTGVEDVHAFVNVFSQSRTPGN